jgi:hypothetical protein
VPTPIVAASSSHSVFHRLPERVPGAVNGVDSGRMNDKCPPITSSDVMTTRFLLAQGETEKTLSHKIRSGEFTRISRGVYVRADRWHQANERERTIARHLAVWKTTQLSFVFSHASAALFHDISLLRLPDRIHITTPQRTFPSNPLVRAHARPHALADWVRYREGPHVTPLARTAFECSLILPVSEGLIVMDQILARGVDKSEVESMVVRGRGRHGIGRARQVLEHADPRCQSVAETMTRFVLCLPGLPPPVSQQPVRTREGAKHLDFGWPRFKLGLEVDGKSKYFDFAPTDQVVFKERHREKLIVAEGWTILRTNWNEITRDPAGLRLRIAAAMDKLR